MQGDSTSDEEPLGRAGDRNFPGSVSLPQRQRYMLLHRLTQMLETGQIDLVLQELHTHLQPDWETTHLELLFELHRQAMFTGENTNAKQSLGLYGSLCSQRQPSTPVLQQQPALTTFSTYDMLMRGRDCSMHTQHACQQHEHHGQLHEKFRHAHG